MTIRQRALVIFDLDGTLFDARRVTIPAVQQTLAAHGLAVPGDDEIGSYIGRPAQEYHDWLAGLCSPGQVDGIIAETDKREFALVSSAGKPFPRVIDTLTALRKMGCALAMSSNAPEDYFAEVLDTQGLRPFFQPALCRGTRFSSKTEMVDAILCEISVRPFVVVGDRHDDIESARAHEGYAVAVSYGFGVPSELAGADAVVDNPAGIPAAVAGLVAGE